MLTKLKNFTRDELQTIVNESTSISEILRKIGYERTGGAYNVELSKYLKENNFNIETIVGRHIKRYDDSGIPKKWLSEILHKNSSGNSSYIKRRLLELRRPVVHILAMVSNKINVKILNVVFLPGAEKKLFYSYITLMGTTMITA